MQITYIAHSGFLAELEHNAFLFDYYQGDIPSVPQNKKLYVFASHFHGDHFNPEIFRLADIHPDIQFVLSDDIFKKNVPAPLLEKTVFLKARTTWTNNTPDTGCATAAKSASAPLAPFSIEVTTLKSTDEGVAFLIHCEGKTIYHPGDLNWWRWEGEPDPWNPQMEKNFKAFIEPLRGTQIDVAFIPLDPRQQDDYHLGMDYFLELTDTKVIYPMHCWEDYSIIDRWFSQHQDSPYSSRIVKITARGDHFTV